MHQHTLPTGDISTSYPLPSGDLITYPALIAALAKPGSDILDSLTPQKVDAWHHASCISGEAGELFTPVSRYLYFGHGFDRENVVEEMGDIEFYAQGLRAALDLPAANRARISDQSVTWYDPKSYMCLPAAAADVFDATKKWILYNKPIDKEAITKALIWMDFILANIRRTLDITLDEVLAHNVMKLGTRYASLGYSDEQAQARADKSGTIH